MALTIGTGISFDYDVGTSGTLIDVARGGEIVSTVIPILHMSWCPGRGQKYAFHFQFGMKNLQQFVYISSVLNFIVCLYGAYGKDCAHYCNCAEPQICDNIIGCCVRDNQTCGLNYKEGLLGKIKPEVGLLNEF